MFWSLPKTSCGFEEYNEDKKKKINKTLSDLI